MTESCLRATSADGTTLACEQIGVGPPVLFVHGTTSDRTRWRPIRDHFQDNTLYFMDRRGRGFSGDHPDYVMRKEFEDIAALARAIDGDVFVVAHSFGAICAMEAALLAPNIRRLVLYEPPVPTPDFPASTDERGVDHIEALIAAGEREEALLFFYRDILRAPESDVVRMQQSADWRSRMSFAHTVPRELRAARRYRLDASRLSELRIPVLLMLGGISPPRYQASTVFLQNAFSRCEVVKLEDQHHNAITVAPDLFAREALAFLTRPYR